MNIFYLSRDPVLCAEMHCDKHVVKMILETAQLLSTAHWELGSTAPYKPTHKNHPLALQVVTQVTVEVVQCCQILIPAKPS